MQKSYRAPNPGDKRPWFIIDAKDQPIGRLAVVVANKLRAKDLPTFDPSVDAGAFVIVTNAALVKLTGKHDAGEAEGGEGVCRARGVGKGLGGCVEG